ncbi:hypothetical protein NC99_15380 [Sunxiuqinia dokdonensis]|uniref:Uncharacterized protein n=1 Tax=Sunxiuqinia dokdonensis TaxID=1409788 RepID=A0A0L8VB20_9BACT|nr:hypothetical protein NC99_15380 [Sunxiuqinia dokdonensis]
MFCDVYQGSNLSVQFLLSIRNKLLYKETNFHPNLFSYF